jgi:hypothetical protein
MLRCLLNGGHRTRFFYGHLYQRGCLLLLLGLLLAQSPNGVKSARAAFFQPFCSRTGGEASVDYITNLQAIRWLA